MISPPRTGLWQLLMALVVLRFLLPFFIQHSAWQPHRDEFLYLDYGWQPGWGYMEVPPLLGLFSVLVKQLPHHLFSIKLFPALFGAATFLLTGHLVVLLGGKRLALLMLFAGYTFSAYLRVFHLYQPGFLEVFSFTLIGYCLVRFFLSKNITWLYAFGVACGFGMLSKYTAAFYLAGLLVALLLTTSRRLFLNKHFWLAGLCGFIIFLPNLWWQFRHNWPVAHHMQELKQTQLQYLSRWSFLKDQLMMLLPVFPVWLAGVVQLATGKALKTFRYIAVQYLVVIALLMLGSAKGYYALGLYPLLFAFGAVVCEKWLNGRSVWVRWMITTPFVLLAIIGVPMGVPIFNAQGMVSYFQKITGSKEPMHEWEDLKKHPLPQDFADMLGWRELAGRVGSWYNGLPQEDKPGSFIFCRLYASAGAINWYRTEANFPRAHSDNGSYLMWMPDSFPKQKLLLVGHNIPAADDSVFQHFNKMEIVDSVVVPYWRETGIKLMLFSQPDSAMRRLAEKSIAEARQIFKLGKTIN